MLIDSKKFHIGANTLMRIAGYKRRSVPDDWVREWHGGRFHAKPLGRGLVEFHFDIYTDDVTKRHFSMRMPLLMAEEKVRIVTRLRSQNASKHILK